MKHLGAGILHTDGKKVLLLYRSKETREHPFTWACAGGGMENGESLFQTAKREAQEEIGSVKGRKVAQFVGDPFVMYIFKVNKPFDVKLNHEHTKSEWVDLDKVEDYKLHPNFKKEWPKYFRAIEKNNHSFSEWINRF